jgi:hypothetical protein
MADDTEKDWAWLREEWVRATPSRRSDLHLMISLKKPENDAQFQKIMKDFHIRFRRGEKHSLIRALCWCVMSRRALPSWVSKELWHSFELFYEGHLMSWEDVFGKPFPGKRRKGASTRRKSLEVWIRVIERREEGAKLDDALFEEIGKEFGFGATTAKNLYYEARNRLKKQKQLLESQRMEKGYFQSSP